MADTDLQQLVINVGTKAQIEAGIAGGTITQDMLSVATDSTDYVTDVKVNNTSVTSGGIANIDLTGKLDKVSTANKVYGTDANGDQTTYDKDSFGQVDDVKINNTSIVTSKVANIPIASSTLGVVKADSTKGINISSGTLQTVSATSAEVTAKTNTYKPLTPSNIDNVVKVGVTTNTNTLTSSEQTTACSWLGASQQTVFRDWS